MINQIYPTWILPNYLRSTFKVISMAMLFVYTKIAWILVIHFTLLVQFFPQIIQENYNVLTTCFWTIHSSCVNWMYEWVVYICVVLSSYKRSCTIKRTMYKLNCPDYICRFDKGNIKFHNYMWITKVKSHVH